MIPTVAFGPGELDRSMVDVISVTGDGLYVLTPTEDGEIPLAQLVDRHDRSDRTGPL